MLSSEKFNEVVWLYAAFGSQYFGKDGGNGEVATAKSDGDCTYIRSSRILLTALTVTLFKKNHDSPARGRSLRAIEARHNACFAFTATAISDCLRKSVGRTMACFSAQKANTKTLGGIAAHYDQGPLESKAAFEVNSCLSKHNSSQGGPQYGYIEVGPVDDLPHRVYLPRLRRRD
jgi:hypothetical protein